MEIISDSALQMFICFLLSIPTAPVLFLILIKRISIGDL